jgi:hypothetical protein
MKKSAQKRLISEGWNLRVDRSGARITGRDRHYVAQDTDGEWWLQVLGMYKLDLEAQLRMIDECIKAGPVDPATRVKGIGVPLVKNGGAGEGEGG